MKPLLIIKTATGFVSMPFSGDLPRADFENMSAFCALKDSYSYRSDGLLAHIEKHFTPPPEPEPAPELVNIPVPERFIVLKETEEPL